MTVKLQCPRCHCSFPLTEEFFYPSRRDERRRVVEWNTYCKECKRAKQREIYRRHMEDPYLRQRRQEQMRRNAANRLARDPEADRRRKRAYEERVRRDPERRRARLETQRMQYYLRAEGNGRRSTPEMRKIDALAEEHSGRFVPLEPFAVLLEQFVAEHGSAEKAAPVLGAHPRTLRAWVNRERPTVQLGRAERILRTVGVRAEDVWPDAFAPAQKPLILGEASRTGKGPPLGGRAARLLADLLKVDGDDPRAAVLEWFDLDHLTRRRPGRNGGATPDHPLRGRVVLLGRRLADAYHVPFWGLWTPKPGARVVAIPHPSGPYNDPEVRRRAGRVLREAVA